MPVYTKKQITEISKMIYSPDYYDEFFQDYASCLVKTSSAYALLSLRDSIKLIRKKADALETVKNVLYGSFKRVPLFINHHSPMVREFAMWRLKHGR